MMGKQVIMLCNVMAEGFRFMPLSLVRLGTFRLSTWVRCNIEAGVNAGARGWMEMSLRDVTIVRDEGGWQGAGDVTHRKRVEVGENRKKVGEL